MLFTKATYLGLLALSAQGLAAPTASATDLSNATALDISLAGVSDDDEVAYMSANPAAVVFARAIGDACDESSFFSTTSSLSPLLADCNYMQAIAATNPQTIYLTIPEGFHTILHYRTCKFGIRNDGGDMRVEIGSSDMRRVITESIKRGFSSNGQIAAKGRMRCGDGINSNELIWGIART